MVAIDPMFVHNCGETGLFLLGLSLCGSNRPYVCMELG